MRIVDFLSEYNLEIRPELADLLIPFVKRALPNVYESAKGVNWTNYNIVNYVMWVDLSAEESFEIKKLIIRILKVYSFT